VFFMSQIIGRSMAPRRYGKIINIASMDSFFGSVLVPAYSATKGGVAQLTKALSNEWAAEGINVNAIAPGYMATTLTDTMKVKNPAQYEETTRRIPMGRWG
ncbi:SDR family NAD(P)-dependent oxidoreductase, partial [Enterocloster bolteae]|uniref:SDR family NAD(P)-dependent oxidoreductase n=1 Tax=Enterocloster bolteae TaxID=208479 RepID=UPI00210A79CF